jgi:hypothetical protein
MPGMSGQYYQPVDIDIILVTTPARPGQREGVQGAGNGLYPTRRPLKRIDIVWHRRKGIEQRLAIRQEPLGKQMRNETTGQLGTQDEDLSLAHERRGTIALRLLADLRLGHRTRRSPDRADEIEQLPADRSRRLSW